MKVVLDEHLPPVLAHGLQAFFVGEHTIVHLRERFGPGVTDVEWIGTLSREGRWVVISGDRQITRRRAEYDAFRASRLIGVFLARGLMKSRMVKQAERILALWESIERLADSVEGGAMFELPMTSTRLRQLK